tara:strand:- start:1117 stop:1863 length:747 start_codon:yes stop_codon:yes gene_type:complete
MVPEINKTVDQLEIAKFSKLSHDWWNPDGKFETLHKINPIRVKFMLDLIFNNKQIDVHADRPLSKLRTLDIGCGGGLSSEPFAKLGAHVCGVDADKQAIEIAKNHAKNENLRIDYKNCSIEDLSLKKDGKFDIILILELLEHIDDTNHFLSIALKYLKKNGVVFVSTINKNIKSMVLAKFAAEYILNWVPRGTHDWNKFITPSELNQMMERHGFTEILRTGVIFDPFSLKWKQSSDVSVNYITSYSRI